MSEVESESFFDRTLGNLAAAWRDVAVSAARSIGFGLGEPALEPPALRSMMRACLEARGGEVMARVRAAELGRSYLRLDLEGRRGFLSILAREFSTDGASVEAACERYRTAEDDAARLAAERALRQELLPARQRLLMQFNALPEGVKFLADLRADLLRLLDGDPYLKALDEDLLELLTSWFDTGFLDLRRITWDSSAALLEKLIAYEAVHEIKSWTDLRNRLDSDRRCYALFHPRMPNEPLAFVEERLDVAGETLDQRDLDETAPQVDPKAADTAIFYSISNTQKGLKGISFGDYLIKMVVQRLAGELPAIKTFATLSPLPHLRTWLAGEGQEVARSLLTLEEQGGIRALGGEDDTAAALEAILEEEAWYRDPVKLRALEAPLRRLTLRYLLERRSDGQPRDPVARFHLRNGARLERINWLGDLSPKGLKESAGLMVNYRYIAEDIEKNHEAFMSDGSVTLSPELKSQAKRVKERADGRRRFGLG